MDNNTPKEAFASLRIKSSVAQNFRKFCKSLSCSQSHGLDLMLDFFSSNQLSPAQNLGPNMKTLEKVLQKRIDALIAIIRNIEKTQIRPTHSMLAALFENLPVNKEKYAEPSFEESLANTVSIQPRIPEQSQPDREHYDIRTLLENMESVTPAFGKHYLKINMSPSEIASLKQKYHVHNH